MSHSKAELRRLVEQMVGEILDEATHRKDLVKSFHDVMSGAIGEYYKARFAELWGDPIPSLRAHWDVEVEDHFSFRFDKLCRRRTKGSYDPGGAFEEALQDLRDDVPSEIAHSRALAAQALRPNDQQRLMELPAYVTDAFFARARQEYESRARPEPTEQPKPKATRGRGKKKFSR